MKIINWKFPKFEKWCKNDHEWKESIGEYNCSISISSWGGNGTTYMCAISTHFIPSNIYAYKIISQSETIKYEDRVGLCNWYNKTIKSVQNEWEYYIRKTYIKP